MACISCVCFSYPGPQRGFQKRLGRRLEEVTKTVRGGNCRGGGGSTAFPIVCELSDRLTDGSSEACMALVPYEPLRLH